MAAHNTVSGQLTASTSTRGWNIQVADRPKDPTGSGDTVQRLNFDAPYSGDIFRGKKRIYWPL